MKANATYSALGRIRRLFIFDTTQYELSEKNSFPFQDVRDKYVDFLTSLNMFNGTERMELYVFFEINPYGFSRGALTDTALGMHFIPVNYIDKEASIVTGWIQDLMYVLPDETLLVSKSNVSEALAKIVVHYAGLKDWKFLERACPGGNVLRGRLNGKDYMMHGYFNKQSCDELFVRQRFGIPLDRLNYVYDNNMKPFEPLFYHADLYSTIIGPVGDNQDELILLAKCDSANYSQVRRGLDDLKKKMQRMRSAEVSTGKSRFIYENLPFLVMRDEKGEIIHALSYNNCLVENFIDEDKKRQIRIYFPDYRKELHDFVQQNQENELVMDFLIESIFSGAGTNVNRQHKRIDPVLTTTFLNEVHELIRKILARHGITQVGFIKHDFRDLAKRLGSLRCMTKVIERDCLS